MLYFGRSRPVWRGEGTSTRSWIGSHPKRKLSSPVLLFFLWWLVGTFRSVPVGSLTGSVIKDEQGIGGKWHIPPSWQQREALEGSHCSVDADIDILKAAECAAHLAQHHHAFLNNSGIPLILHQTWRDLRPKTWNGVFRNSVEAWLQIAVGDGTPERPETAFFLWDDEAIRRLIKTYEPSLYEGFNRLPYPVEKSDVFRIVVLKWFGGVYADMDTEPLRHPFTWIEGSDLESWTDASSGKEFTVHATRSRSLPAQHRARVTRNDVIRSGVDVAVPVATINAIFGIEADNPPEPDPTYWRMGYTYPVQITNWALCMGVHHPIADQFIETLTETLGREENLSAVDPLDITGPPALTTAAKTVAEEETPEFSWNALSCRKYKGKGGRSKVVAGDTLILPITGFNPGRGWFHNMGSQKTTHRNARLRHVAVGSWKKPDPKVHYGKLCRVLFGLCKDWKKIPDV